MLPAALHSPSLLCLGGLSFGCTGAGGQQWSWGSVAVCWTWVLPRGLAVRCAAVGRGLERAGSPPAVIFRPIINVWPLYLQFRHEARVILGPEVIVQGLTWGLYALGVGAFLPAGTG